MVGQNIPTPGVPESFKVLVKELQSLGLDLRVLDAAGEEIELARLGEEDLDAPNIVSDEGENEVTADDVGHTVETDDLYDSYTDENPDDELMEPDDDVLFAQEKSGKYDDFGMDDEF